MIFLISLALALLFALLFGKYLRLHPVPFYVASAGIAAAVAVLTWCSFRFPSGFSQWVWPIFSRGGLAGGLFVIVMFTGAFPNGSAPMKRLMPIRGQLSIIASILTLGHNAAYGKTYFIRLFTASASLPVNQLLAAVCSVIMLIIILPLFITSFMAVRRKMNPKKWKKLQRSAYIFYALLCCHILLLTVPSAAEGNHAYRLTVFVYSAVFLSYTVCRGLKSASKKSHFSLAKKQIGSAACCCAAAWGFVLCLPLLNSTQQPDDALQNFSVVEALDAGTSGVYQDGVFTGSAMGMNAAITVSVTIQNDTITNISVDSSRDDEPYFTDALSVIDRMVEANSTDVDTVSGATYSSGGIIDATANALKQAKINGEPGK